MTKEAYDRIVGRFHRQGFQHPLKGHPTDKPTLHYIYARTRNHAHSMMLERYGKTSITFPELVTMLDRNPDQVRRMLSGPGEMSLRDFSDVCFALGGTIAFEFKPLPPAPEAE